MRTKSSSRIFLLQLGSCFGYFPEVLPRRAIGVRTAQKAQALLHLRLKGMGHQHGVVDGAIEPHPPGLPKVLKVVLGVLKNFWVGSVKEVSDPAEGAEFVLGGPVRPSIEIPAGGLVRPQPEGNADGGSSHSETNTGNGSTEGLDVD